MNKDSGPTGVAQKKKAERRSGVQVIARAAMVLRCLEDEPDGLSLGDIAGQLNLPRSTVQRIVVALVDEQMLIAASAKSRVKLGPALIRLAGATNVEIEQIAHPIMEAISREINETIDLSVIQGKSAVFVDQVLGNHRLRTVSAVGERFPLHCTACGKALLVHLPEKKLEQILNAELEVFTENTVTDPEMLREQINNINGDLGYDLEEHTEGVCAVGVSFHDPLGRAFAISIPVPTNRFHRNKTKLEVALRECRRQILDILGDFKSAD